MSRLIDADAFRRFAHEQLEGNKTYSIDEILEMIDEQPTAFNKAKVIMQLKRIRVCNVEIYDKDNESWNDDILTFDEAIDIVKRGGVE